MLVHSLTCNLLPQIHVLLVNTESPLLVEMMLVCFVQLTVSSLLQTVLFVSVSKVTTDTSWKMPQCPALVRKMEQSIHVHPLLPPPHLPPFLTLDLPPYLSLTLPPLPFHHYTFSLTLPPLLPSLNPLHLLPYTLPPLPSIPYPSLLYPSSITLPLSLPLSLHPLPSCIGPPSACRNLLVIESRTRANTITVMWERPLITGRDDYYYNIYHSNPDLQGSFFLHNINPLITTSPLVRYSVSGLRPLTNYTIRVSVLNAVSDQDTAGEEGRRCEVTAMTGDISKSVDYRVLQEPVAIAT